MINKVSPDLLYLIKKAGATRRFNDRAVPQGSLDRVLEAGIWGPSVLGIQPWSIVCIKNMKMIRKISDICLKKSNKVVTGANMVMRISSLAIRESKVLIAIYNKGNIRKRVSKLGKKYTKRAYKAELQSIGAVMQNMFLEANSLGLGALWLDAPTLCEREIGRLLKVTGDLIAFLAVGYASIKPVRAKRNIEIKII